MLWAGAHPALTARPGLGSSGHCSRAPLPSPAGAGNEHPVLPGSAQGQSSQTPRGVYAKPPRLADAKQCKLDSLCNEGRRCRLKGFQGEYHPSNLWSLVAPDVLLKIHLVGLQKPSQ